MELKLKSGHLAIVYIKRKQNVRVFSVPQIGFVLSSVCCMCNREREGRENDAWLRFVLGHVFVLLRQGFAL